MLHRAHRWTGSEDRGGRNASSLNSSAYLPNRLRARMGLRLSYGAERAAG
jgi:hypothetical protein